MMRWTALLVAVTLAAGLAGAVGTSAHMAPGPLVVDGDPIATLATGAAGDILVVGRDALYQLEAASETWSRVGPVPPSGQLVIAEDDPTLVLAGEHPPCARGDGEPLILHRSGDGGASWQAATGGEGVQPLAAWSAAGVAVGVGCDGLHLSRDGGQTWSPLAVDLEGREVTAFSPIRGSADPVLSGLVTTTSEGGTSRLSQLDLTDPAVPVVGPVLKEFWGLAAVATADETILLGAADGVWRSDDGGRTWARQRTGLEAVTLADDPLVTGVPPDIEPGSFGIGTLLVDAAGGGRLLAGTADGVYASDDEGAIWSRLDGADGLISALAVAPDGASIFAQTEDGVIVLA